MQAATQIAVQPTVNETIGIHFKNCTGNAASSNSMDSNAVGCVRLAVVLPVPDSL